MFKNCGVILKLISRVSLLPIQKIAAGMKELLIGSPLNGIAHARFIRNSKEEFQEVNDASLIVNTKHK